VLARIHGDTTARLVNADGSVVAEGKGEIAAPVEELSDVFVLDLEGRNRYVMTTAATLAPLLDLPPARVSVNAADGLSPGRLVLRNEGPVAAIGLVLEGPERTLFEDNVIDLLPGEERAIAVEGAAATVTAQGWNAQV
jgi:hypothetical protein